MERISTSLLFSLGAERIGRQQSEWMRTQQQLATGRRMLATSADPVAAAEALRVDQALAEVRQYGANRGIARDTMAIAEAMLAEAGDVLLEVRTLLVRAANGALADSDRRAIAIEVEGRFQQLLALANATAADGTYLFAGHQAGSPPFVETPAGVAFVGDEGERRIAVAAGRDMAVSASGAALFDRANGAKSVFTTLRELAQLLSAPVSDADVFAASVQQGLRELDGAAARALAARARFGAQLRELDDLADFGAAVEVHAQAQLSRLRDLDYAEAASRFAAQQLALEAAQRSYLRVTALSLFDYL